ncbi:MAG: hypothetical protein H0W49_01710 [Nitrospirales bacterium]|nr:hypothetical protein [Nitrospirales bacterium]
MNRKTLEPALRHMPVVAVVVMVAADMAGHARLHERAECFLGGWLHNNVEGVGHEEKAKAFDEGIWFSRRRASRTVRGSRHLYGSPQDRRSHIELRKGV